MLHVFSLGLRGTENINQMITITIFLQSNFVMFSKWGLNNLITIPKRLITLT
jgi:hypothetical protein